MAQFLSFPSFLHQPYLICWFSGSYFYIAVVRGENARQKYGFMVKSSVAIAAKKLEEIQAIILLQSGKHSSVYCQVYTQAVTVDSI